MKKSKENEPIIKEEHEYVIGNRVAKVTSVFKTTGDRTISDAFIAIIKRDMREKGKKKD